MNPNEKEPVVSLELPSVEAGEPTGPVKQEGSERNPEFLPPQASTTDDPGLQVQTPAPHASAAPSSEHTNVSSVQSGSITVQTPHIADDIDLIEKEWVEKAKEIVEKTRENPYLQNKAISEIKADYIKKRYNREIAKSSE